MRESRNQTSRPTIFELTPRQRLQAGARRGALFGVYFAVLLFVVSLLKSRDATQYSQTPVTGGASIMAGFAAAGAMLAALVPTVRRTIAALGLGVACMFLVLLGVGGALSGWTAKTVAFAAILALPLGGIFGTLYWKGWYRRSTR